MIVRLAQLASVAALATGCAAATSGNGGGGGGGNSPDASSPRIDGGSEPVADAPETAHPDASTPTQPDAAQASSDVVAVPLTTESAFQYYATVKIGGKSFNLSLDTGSSTLGVASSQCSSCQVDAKYTPGTGAASTGATASSTYADGTGWSGPIYKDKVQLGAGPSVTVAFANITSQVTGSQGQPFFEGNDDGIIGLGPDLNLLSGTTAYVDPALASPLADEMAFQFCPDGGTMWLGGYGAAATAQTPVFGAMYTQTLSQIPFDAYYAVELASMKIGSTSLGSETAVGPAVIDTGTSISFVPSTVLSAMETAIEGSSGYKQIFGTQKLTDDLTTSESSATIDAMLPELVVTLPGSSTTISLPATRSYLTYQQGDYEFAFDDSSEIFGTGVKASLFGDTFLAGVVAVIDRANSTIGFAAEKGCAAPDQVAGLRPAVRTPRAPGDKWWKNNPNVHVPHKFF